MCREVADGIGCCELETGPGNANGDGPWCMWLPETESNDVNSDSKYIFKLQWGPSQTLKGAADSGASSPLWSPIAVCVAVSVGLWLAVH